MDIVVFNNGVVHACSRTISFSKYFKNVYYIDIKGIDSEAIFLGTNIQYFRPFPDNIYKYGDFKIQRLLRKLKPDGIVCHYASGVGLYNSLLYGKCPVGVIAMGHDVLYDKGDGQIPGFQKYLIRLSLRNCDYISAKSILIKERLEEYKVKSKINVNYWGGIINSSIDKNKETCREILGLHKDDQILLSPRAIEPRLNTFLLVESFNDILKILPNLRLILIGRSLRSYKADIVQYIQMNNLSSRITLLNECSSKELFYYYQASDAVISIAKSDGFPNCVLEAMVYKRPTIVGNITQVRELLKNNVNSRLCELNRDSISEAISEVFNEQHHYQNEIVTNAFELVKNVGDINMNGSRFASDFIEIIRNRRWSFSHFFISGIYKIKYVLILFYRKSKFTKIIS